MHHVEIWKEADRYCSFPHVVRLPDGTLGLAFRRASQFSADAARAGVATHHDPDSSIEMLISTDDGATWPSASRRTIYRSATYGVNDPSLTVLRDGSLICRVVALDIRPSRGARPSGPLFSHRVEHGLVTTVVGNVLLRSTDGGTSWAEIGLGATPETGPSCSRDPMLEMPDGSWLLPVYSGAPQRSDISWVIRSFDDGAHWTESTRIASDDAGRYSQLQGVNYNETSLLHLGNGELLAMIRADAAFHTDDQFMPVGGVGSLFTARSYDGGLSWSAPQNTGIFGQPGSLLALADGRLLVTYGCRRAPYGVRACVSHDRGATWDVANEIILRDDAPTWDCGYPFTIELAAGRLLTVYYLADAAGTRHVAGTHWTLP